MLRRILSLFLCLASASVAAASLPAASRFLVLGVIASADQDKGVVLLKNMNGGEAFAARVGAEVAAGVFIDRITRDYVYMRMGRQSEAVKVGEQLDTANPSSYSTPTVAAGSAPVLDAAGTGIEKSGNTVRITSALRDHVAGDELSKVMMQAAAIPYYENGALVGFKLTDIDAGSLYQKAGFVDGDIVTSINGQRLSDVALAIRVLQSLKTQPSADISFLRAGTEQKLQIVIQ